MSAFVNHHIREEQNQMFPQDRSRSECAADKMGSGKQQLTDGDAEEAAA